MYLHLKRIKTSEIVFFSFEILEVFLRMDWPAALVMLLLIQRIKQRTQAVKTYFFLKNNNFFFEKYSDLNLMQQKIF